VNFEKWLGIATRARCQSKFTRLLFWLALVGSFVLVRPCHAAGVAPAEASVAQRKSADRKLAEGKKLLKAGKVDQALVAFEAAHDTVAQPEAALMIARAQQSMGELVKAHAAYTRAVAEAEAALGSDEKQREVLQAAKRELVDLEGVLARLTIKLRYAPDGTNVTIDGEALGTRQLGEPILVPPGQIKVVAQSPDGREASRQVTLTAGQDAKVELAFVRDDAGQDAPVAEPQSETVVAAPSDPEASPSSPGSGKRTAAFIAGGVGVAGLATFGVLGTMSNSKYSELEEACPNAQCSSDEQANIDEGKLYQTLANIGLVVGVVGLGTSAALFLMGGPRQPEQAARVQLRVGLRSIELRGSFQ
jgi:tetratricopeptide (TPR) repeat protein